MLFCFVSVDMVFAPSKAVLLILPLCITELSVFIHFCQVSILGSVVMFLINPIMQCMSYVTSRSINHSYFITYNLLF